MLEVIDLIENQHDSLEIALETILDRLEHAIDNPIPVSPRRT